MLTESEVLALATLMRRSEKEAELAMMSYMVQIEMYKIAERKNQYANQPYATNAYIRDDGEANLLRAHVNWIFHAVDLYKKQPDKYAGMTLAEFVGRMRAENVNGNGSQDP